MKHYLEAHGELHSYPLLCCMVVHFVKPSFLLVSMSGALPFVPQFASVCGFSTSNVIGLILFKLNPMSFSLKNLNQEKEPDLLICGCLLSLCMITLHFLFG